MGERLICIQEVSSSILLSSTIYLTLSLHKRSLLKACSSDGCSPALE